MTVDYTEKLSRAKANLKAEQKKKYKIHDFCKNFRLEDEIKEKSFNNKYSDPKLIHIFSKSCNYTQSLHNAIITRSINETNLLLIIFGEPNSGKSTVGRKVGHEIIDQNKIILEKEIALLDSFTTSEFNMKLPLLNIGDVMIRDESPKEHGKGTRNMQENLGNIVDIIRKHLNSFIFIAPRKLTSILVTYYLETAGKNKETGQIRCLLYDPSFKDGKEPVGRIYFDIDEDPKLKELYEKRKDGFIVDGIKHGGHYSAQIDLERFKRDINSIFKWCMREKVDQKNLIEPEIYLYNSKFDPDTERDKMVKWDSSTMPMLINKTWSKVKRKRKRIESRKKRMQELKKVHEKKMEEKRKEHAKIEIEQHIKKDLTKFDFRFDDLDIYDLIRIEKEGVWRNVERDIEIYSQATKEKLLYNEIAKSYKTIKGKTGISEVVRKVQGEVNRIKGRLLEDAFTKYLQSLEVFDKVENNGAHGEFDVAAYKNNKVFVFSLKNIKVDKQHYDAILGEEYYPEVKFAREQKERHKKEVYAYLGIFDNILEIFSIKSIDLSYPVKPIKI
ncbi:MAG: hypothetical protein KJI71_01650 [Patescibacteria group bacterium]|nr:hypothetical protein [Patescibacteria group bacterium]